MLLSDGRTDRQILVKVTDTPAQAASLSLSLTLSLSLSLPLPLSAHTRKRGTKYVTQTIKILKIYELKFMWEIKKGN